MLCNVIYFGGSNKAGRVNVKQNGIKFLKQKDLQDEEVYFYFRVGTERLIDTIRVLPDVGMPEHNTIRLTARTTDKRTAGYSGSQDTDMCTAESRNMVKEKLALTLMYPEVRKGQVKVLAS